MILGLFILFLTACFSVAATNRLTLPPMPTAPKVHRVLPSKAKVKITITGVPVRYTVAWKFPTNIDPGHWAWTILGSSDVSNWSVVLTNASGPFIISNDMKPGLHVYRLIGHPLP